MYIDTATDAVLKGLGEQVYTMNVNIIDALISVIMVWLLVPRFGIGGYLITIYVSEFFNTVFSITHLLSLARPTLRLIKWIYKPLLAIVGATTLTKLVFRLPGLPPLPWGLALGVCILLYLGLLLLFGDAEREDLCWFRSLFCKETH
jgi:stage V sporulation protein B